MKHMIVVSKIRTVGRMSKKDFQAYINEVSEITDHHVVSKLATISMSEILSLKKTDRYAGIIVVGCTLSGFLAIANDYAEYGGFSLCFGFGAAWGSVGIQNLLERYEQINDLVTKD
jgi:hypothetical protein